MVPVGLASGKPLRRKRTESKQREKIQKINKRESIGSVAASYAARVLPMLEVWEFGTIAGTR